MALRRLGWSAVAPNGIVVNDRVMRMAQEQAGRLLRSAGWRAALTTGILETWPAEPLKRTPEEWDAVRAAVQGGERIPSAVIRARTRQVQRFVAAEGRLPADVFELESPPGASGVLLLSACDRQQATIERSDTDPRHALLRLQLPVRPDPRGHRDWEWIAVPLVLPPTIPARAVLHLPALRVVNGSLRADVAFSSAVPRARRDGHVTALGVDWGLNTLLSAGVARLRPDGTITALGAGGQYRASGVLARQHKLRRHGELLQAKADQHDRIIASDERHSLAARKAVLDEEARRVAERRSNLNSALAWSAARWAVDQAIAARATVIYLEDLRTLEARGMGRTMNVRLSQAVRGQLAERIRHLAAEAGIAVVTVPARNTSRLCPGCLTPLRHRKAPGVPVQPGWKWAVCPGCGWQGDRDQGAWQRIAARGLAHQRKTTTDRSGGTMAICAVDDAIEQRAVITAQAPGRDRSKAGPTARRITPRRVPRRRAAPSPAAPARAWRPASGGTRHNGPATAPESGIPGPGRAHDQRHSRPPRASGTWGGARRRVPSARPRHPAQMGTRSPAHPAPRDN